MSDFKPFIFIATLKREEIISEKKLLLFGIIDSISHSSLSLLTLFIT